MLLDPYYANDRENKWGYPLSGHPKNKQTKKQLKEVVLNMQW
jgi:hypothetical protein